MEGLNSIEHLQSMLSADNDAFKNYKEAEKEILDTYQKLQSTCSGNKELLDNMYKQIGSLEEICKYLFKNNKTVTKDLIERERLLIGINYL